MSFLYLSCSAIMDSPGGKFNSYKSKRLGHEVFQTSKNIVIVEDFRIMDKIMQLISMNVVIEMKLYIRFFQTIANSKLINL